MVSVKGTASKLEMEILGGIIEPDCPNIEFKNTTFDCKSIKDAAGHIFMPVVLCKDCKGSEVFQNDSSGVMARYCKAFTLKRMVADDDYCSYGERCECDE